MPVKPKDDFKINTYGYPDMGCQQITYDMWAFAERLPPDRGVPPRLQLFRNISDVMLPGLFEWHAWSEQFVEACCTHSLIGATGCGGSAKTFNSSAFAAQWWLCDPPNSSVMFISTSVKMLRRRAWANISSIFSRMGDNRIGNFIDSRLIWQSSYGDDKNAIFGKAVEDGSVSKVADDIKGVHTERQMIVLDEARAIPAAIWDAISNLYAYPKEFILIVMGNIRSRLDHFGRWCEPANGWTGVTVDDEEWEGRPQSEYGGRVPWIMHFDAEKSPNIIEGKIVSKHLPMPAKVEAARKNAGNSALYWSNMRGFPPPEGLTKTVFTEVSLQQHEAFGEHRFFNTHMLQVIAFLDPAFGGNDNAVITFAVMGQLQNNDAWGIQAMEPITIKLDIEKKETIHFQLADEVIRLCETFKYQGVPRPCAMENLGVDASGEGGGLCSIIERKKGRRIIWVEFAAAASEDAVNLEDGRPANTVYRNKRAEIHFRTQNAVQSGQLKGISQQAAKEACTIKFDDEKKLITIQSKKDYRKENNMSPDYFDSFCGLSEVARLRGFRLAAIEKTVNRFAEFSSMVKDSQLVYEDTYSPEELPV